MSDSSFESDDDCDGLLRKALDVDFPEDFNPNSIPQNGQEYLHHVIYERNQCEKLVISNIDPNKYRKNQTYAVKVKDPVKTSINHYLPSNSWQHEKIQHFLHMKHFLEKYNDGARSTKTLTTFDENDFIEKMKNQLPSFSEFQTLSQAIKIKMLELIMRHLNSLEPGNSISDNVGTWIFAVLVMLEIPLSPSCCHIIREFARTCIELRSQLSENADENLYVPLNFCICICSRCFGQLDLSD
ncbi:unnamed protein product [Phaedon cochleariae]|uniref:Gem-associated protein 2 n=1 Tax=Phaedon cochleariae TaxID=80249 RepID=A0A9P0DM71_PHACE|nr:unnamed protein product [Phaedon cochleariae]